MINFPELAAELTGETHPLYATRDRMLAEGKHIVDLVRGNVTEHGLSFPKDLLREILSDAMELTDVYHPDPFGQLRAREAIQAYYAGLTLSADRILLTPGTSISYWYCFKLLAGSGDEILSPKPSYPLLDYIARLSGVTLKTYRLDETRQWAIDFADLISQITPKTRAIVLISPHNPTGAVCSNDDIYALAGVAAKYQLPIISDEVFGEFLFGVDRLPQPAASDAPLVFTLNGFSKSFALPGLKLGWIAVSGDESLVKQSLAVLEMISDTFLPVSEFVQASVPMVFERGQAFQRRYVKTIADLRDTAITALHGLQYSPPQGGFYLTLPIQQDEDDAALSLLQRHSLLVHPGHFYEIEGNHIVATFINAPDVLSNCMHQIKEVLWRASGNASG